MDVRRCDIAILGGGLAGGLIALALARHRPDLTLLLVEQDDRLGGNHVWSFFSTDTDKPASDLLAPIVTATWSDYEVRFPDQTRTLDTSYCTMTSSRLDEALRAALPVDAILAGQSVTTCSEEAATLGDGTLTLAVDGVVRQSTLLSKMIWDVPGIIAHLSRLVTLQPGDLIFTGTPAGVGPILRGQTCTVTVGTPPSATVTIT
jgi:hypothetical protein